MLPSMICDLFRMLDPSDTRGMSGKTLPCESVESGIRKPRMSAWASSFPDFTSRFQLSISLFTSFSTGNSTAASSSDPIQIYSPLCLMTVGAGPELTLPRHFLTASALAPPLRLQGEAPHFLQPAFTISVLEQGLASLYYESPL